jgi:PAS domain S-box-containing protein
MKKSSILKEIKNNIVYIFIYNVITIKSNFSKLKHTSGNQEFVLIASDYCINALSPENAACFDEIHTIPRDFHHADYAKIEKIVLSYLSSHSAENIRLLTNEDSAQLVCAKLNEKYNIPGFTTDDILPFVDKATSKKILTGKIKLPKFELFDKIKYQKTGNEYLHKIIQKIGLPIFIKPIDLVSSLYTYKVNSLEEFMAVADEIMNYQYQFEVDEFIDGDLFHCDTLMNEGKIVFFTAAKYACPLSLFSKGAAIGSLPVADKKLFKRLGDFTKETIKNLAGKNGGYHLEVFLNKKDELVFLKIAARTPGALVPVMYEIQFGFNIEELHYTAHMGLLSNIHVNTNRNKFAAWITYPKPDGVIIDFKQPKVDAKYKFINHVTIGEKSATTKSLLDGACSFVLWDNSLKKLQQSFEYLKSHSPIRVEKTKNADTANHYEVMTELFNAMPHVFWKDKQGVYQGCNLNEAKTFGCTIDEFVGKTIFDLCDENTAKHVNDTDNKIMQERHVVTLEETVLTEQGGRVYLSQKMPRYNSNGEVIGMLGFSVDITEMKRNEQIQNMVQQCLETVQHTIHSCKINILHKTTGETFPHNPLEKTRLTRREQEILYYLSLNKSPKEIAKILGIVDGKMISSATILSIICKQLYTKFEVCSVGLPVEKAALLNLIPFLPEGLSKRGS